jgi:cytidylate kinase
MSNYEKQLEERIELLEKQLQESLEAQEVAEEAQEVAEEAAIRFHMMTQTMADLFKVRDPIDGSISNPICLDAELDKKTNEFMKKIHQEYLEAKDADYAI